ncbi:MAG: hypothetical protein ACI9LM_005208 [Alteromonadaceae bacterium]|jgi:hypothetical protein
MNISLKQYKAISLIGTSMIAIGSLASCLGTTPIDLAGDIILLSGLVISTLGFSGWEL